MIDLDRLGANIARAAAFAILAYGQSAQVWNEMSQRSDHKSYSLPSPDLARLREQHVDDGRTMLAMAARGPEIGTREVVLAEWQQARELDLPISVHVGNGTWSAVTAPRYLRLQSDRPVVHETGQPHPNHGRHPASTSRPSPRTLSTRCSIGPIMAATSISSPIARRCGPRE